MIKKRHIKRVLQWLLIFMIAIVVAICLRVFVLAKFTIPTPSMEPAILPGDRVIVSKLTPGPRIIRNLFSLWKDGKPEISRLRMFGVKRNDVLVFNFPYPNRNRLGFDYQVYYAKRCVAIPGDTFYIENGIYKVKNCPDTLGNYEAQLHFSKKKAEEIRPEIFRCFPRNDNYQWNVKQFGPLYVPRKGDTLAIDAKNVALYKNLIRYETDREVRVANDTVYVGGEPLHAYVFRQNYYFMAGDLVRDSKDSRYWGLLPEEHIVGKVAIVY